MPSARVAWILSLLWLGTGCSEGLERVLRETGQPALRQIAAEEARSEAERGALLLQPWPLAAGEVRVPAASRVAAGESPPAGDGQVVILGDSPAAWALAARMRREGRRAVALAPARAEDWPRPRARLDDGAAADRTPSP